MATGLLLLLGLSSALSCATPVYLYLNPRNKAVGSSDASMEDDELQAYRNELSALYNEDEAQQAIFDQADENTSEDLADLISLRRSKNYYEEKRSTPCSANIHDLAMKVDCGRNAVKQFKLSPCGSGLYKYDYTCLKGIDAKVFDETQGTPKVFKGESKKIMDGKRFDLRTMYRHNARCDVGGIGGTSDENRTEMDSVGETPISQFRYDFIVDPSNHYLNTTQYLYKCLATPTSGQCQNYETPSGALKPEDLVADGAMGLQGMDVACPGEDQVLTRFQLRGGTTADDGTYVIPPFPRPEEKSVYRYDYTCCKMEA